MAAVALGGRGAPSSEVGTLRARVEALEGENRRLTTTLKRTVLEHRTRAEGLQGELARVQHLCNELTFAMVMHGVDPSSLSGIVAGSLRFDVGATLTQRTASQATPTKITTSSRAMETQTTAAAASLGALPVLASPTYQLAPPMAPPGYGHSNPQHHKLRFAASPPEAYIPEALRKRLDATDALVQRLGSPATWERGGGGGSAASTPQRLAMASSSSSSHHRGRSRSALGMAHDAATSLGLGPPLSAGGLAQTSATDGLTEWPAVDPTQGGNAGRSTPHGGRGDAVPTPPPGARPPHGADGDRAGDSGGGRRGRRLMRDPNEQPPPSTTRTPVPLQ
jgi:hypothetical protein